MAQAVAAGIGHDAETTIVEAKDAPAAIDGDVDLFVVGGINQKTGLPGPDTRAEAAVGSDGALQPAERGLREWLADVRLVRRAQPAAVWDTRIASPRILDLIDRSGPTIAGRLRRAGGRHVGKPAKFYSAGGVGALVVGEEERAHAWGVALGDLVRCA